MLQTEADTRAAQLARFIDDVMTHAPIEVEIVTRVFNALAEAGTPIVKVDDGEELNDVTTLRDVQEQVFNLDQAYLLTKSGSWVRLVMGEGWDTICDYTVDLEDALAPVNTWISSKW